MSDLTLVAPGGVDLRSPRFHLTWTGMTVSEQPAFDEWAAFGEALRFAARAVAWWWGDWLNYGERAYGEKYSQAVEESDYELGTLKNFAWVCANVRPSLRRDDLSFGHHACVAPLRYEDGSPNEELQRHYLAVAAVERLTVAELRQRIKEDTGAAKAETVEPVLCGAVELLDVNVNGAAGATITLFAPASVDVEALLPLVGHLLEATLRPDEGG